MALKTYVASQQGRNRCTPKFKDKEINEVCSDNKIKHNYYLIRKMLDEYKWIFSEVLAFLSHETHHGSH